MSPDRAPLAAFDDEVVEAVASEEGVDADELAALVARHQESVRELPGVTDLVYEWRKYLPYDPLVARTDEAFHLVVLPAVWEEFERGGFSAAEVGLLRAVHDRQARLDARGRGDDESVYDDAAPIVLTRL